MEGESERDARRVKRHSELTLWRHLLLTHPYVSVLTLDESRFHKA